MKETELINFKLSFNRSRHLNKNGESRIDLECRQGKKRIYISTKKYCEEKYWVNGHYLDENNEEYSNMLNCFLNTFKMRIEGIYYDIYRTHGNITLSQFKDIISKNENKGALLEDFGRIVVNESDRKDVTIKGYDTLFNDINKFRENTTIEDVDYNFIIEYVKYMKENGLKENTIIGRMQQLRAIMNEAVKRNVIPVNPFNRYKIGTMKNKRGYLTIDQVKSLEKLKLSGLEKTARDAFLIGCYTGLRFSDIKTLKNEHIKDGWIHKVMIKTNKEVNIPVKELFNGKFFDIVESYHGNIENLSKKIGENGQLNQALKKVFTKANIDPNGKSFHLSRHTFGTLVMEGKGTNNGKNVDMSIVSKLLGHTKIATSAIYCEYTKDTIINGLNLKSKKSN